MLFNTGRVKKPMPFIFKLAANLLLELDNSYVRTANRTRMVTIVRNKISSIQISSFVNSGTIKFRMDFDSHSELDLYVLDN